MITAGMLMKIGGSRAKADICGPLAEAFNKHAPAFGLDREPNTSQFLGQCAVESAGFSDLDENLSYSAERLTKVWPRRFPTIAAAQPFARNPEALANKTYGGRMGNNNPGDGWKFRGRGIKMLTGRDNYTAFQRWLDKVGLGHLGNVVNDPDLVERFPHAFLSAVWFWDANNLSAVASDTTASTKKINGGTIGLQDRIAAVKRAQQVLSEGSGEIETNVRVAADDDKDGDGIRDVMRVGLIGPDVKVVNAALRAVYPEFDPEQAYSMLTAQFVRRFQQENGLGADGVWGPRTEAAMERKLGIQLKVG